MSYDWMVGIPAWGPFHVDVLLRATLPAIGIAAKRIKGSIRFVIHTDQREAIAAWFAQNMPQAAIDYRPEPPRVSLTKPAKNRYIKLGDAERLSLTAAQDGECVSLVNADVIVSEDWFASAESHFDQGKSLVVLYGGGRTCGDLPPVGVTASDLRAWAWEHRHPWISDCLWGSGATRAPFVLFFEKDDTVICRGFHLYTTAAFRKNRELHFNSLTADGGQFSFAPSNYKRDEMHVITSKDEMGFAEVSPADRSWGSTVPLSIPRMVDWAKSPKIGICEWNHWLFSHRFFIKGNGDPGDREICNEILKQIR